MRGGDIASNSRIERAERPTTEPQEAEPSRVTGTVRFASDNGFGFIEVEGDLDVFFHVSQLQGRWDDLFEGARVTFEHGVSERTGKPCAMAVRREG